MKLLKNPNKTRKLIASILKINENIKSKLKFNFNIDKALQNFFIGVSQKFSEIKKVIQEEREKQRKAKIVEIERERKQTQEKLSIEKNNELKAKEEELRIEIKLGKERKNLRVFLVIHQRTVNLKRIPRIIHPKKKLSLNFINKFLINLFFENTLSFVFR